MSQKTPQYTSIGGQAVIEGVMMRSPNFIAVAVRKPDGGIAVRTSPYVSWLSKFPILKKPVLRGVFVLLESMIQGMEALSFSAQFASEEDAKESEKLSKLAIATSMVFAIALGLGLFVVLPHALTAWITSGAGPGLSTDSPAFHLIDGSFKMAILLLYVYLISKIPDIHRVFQYHGAEHKSIYAFEAQKDLTVANAREYITLHPRCGTSFLLFLVLISVLVFSVVFPLVGISRFSDRVVINHLAMVALKISLMLPVAGIAYEFIKVCAFRMDNPIFKILIWPGLKLQRLTTREPDDQQLEVALVSLRQVLLAEKGIEKVVAPREQIIVGLSALEPVSATVKEFSEA